MVCECRDYCLKERDSDDDNDDDDCNEESIAEGKPSFSHVASCLSQLSQLSQPIHWLRL